MNNIKIIEIAKAVNLTHAAVSFWFSGKSSPNPTQIEIMDKKFKIPPQAWYDILAYINNNSERFGTITRRRKGNNGNTEV